MEVNERASYLKGLAEGIGLDQNNPEHKLIGSLIEAIAEISEELNCIQSQLDELNEDFELLDEEVGIISEEFEGMLFDDDDDDDCGHDCCCIDDEIEDLELDCPACEEPITISDDMFSDGRFACPHCGESLEIDLGEEDDLFLFDEEED